MIRRSITPITEYADGSEVVAPVEPQFGANWDPGHYDNISPEVRPMDDFELGKAYDASLHHPEVLFGSETSDGSDLIKDASGNHGWKSPYDYQRGVQETVFNRQPGGSYKKG